MDMPSSLSEVAEKEVFGSKYSIVDLAPKIGMKFVSENHAYVFYNKYAGSIGFSVRKDFLNKSKEGVVISRRFVCYKRGFRLTDKRHVNVKKPWKEVKTGWLVQMTISRKLDGKYQLIHFEGEHNHELVPKEQAHMLPSQRKVTAAQAAEADKSGIPQKLAFEFMSRQVGGRENVGYLLVDYNNYLRTKRKKDMKEGDAGCLLSYFQKQQVENPSFFYALQLDIDDQITNVFWADARMVIDYNHFGEVVSFDTTYKTNQLSRPLAVFVGLNHHREMVIFGAALLYDECAESFQWLFKTFMQAMSGKKPITILTDQDHAMAKAIKLVFPESNHRLCSWHMWQNAMKHLGHHFKSGDSFGKDLKSCIKDHEKKDEFFQAWEAFLNKYNLQENDWLASRFKEKEKWAMVYGRRTFSAGMKSTQLSESFNSCLKKYLKLDLDVARFFNHFERAVAGQRYNEMSFDYNMSQRIPILNVPAIMLKHARDIYTPNMFELFQKEFAKGYVFVVNLCNENDSLFEYKVSHVRKPWEHTVTLNSKKDTVFCSCMEFEFARILCCHALKVLDINNIKVVPEKYFIKRWTKSAKVGSVRDVHGSIVEEDLQLVMSSCYKELSRTAIKLTTWAAEFDKGFKILNGIFKEGMFQLEKLHVRKCDTSQNDKILIVEDANTVKNKDDNNKSIVGDDNKNHKVKKLKKRERAPGGKHRLKGCLEKGSKKRKDRSNQPTTPNNIHNNQTLSTSMKPVSSPMPSNLIQSLSYSHPQYYPWQAPFHNPQLQGLQSSQENLIAPFLVAPGLMVGLQHCFMLKQSSSICNDQQNPPTIPYSG